MVAGHPFPGLHALGEGALQLTILLTQRLHLQPGKRFEGKRRDFYAEIVESGVESEEGVTEIAARHDIDELMLAEQFRRGFMARKPIEGQPDTTRVHPTTKALTRYGLLDKAG